MDPSIAVFHMIYIRISVQHEGVMCQHILFWNHDFGYRIQGGCIEPNLSVKANVQAGSPR